MDKHSGQQLENRRKVYIWGFPGVGKSSVRSHHLIVDADCKLFQFHMPAGANESLHSRENRYGIQPQPDYPQNYLDYVSKIDADIVFLNCHLSLLKDFEQETLLLVYPSVELKDEYLRRYESRGDHNSFIDYMNEFFEDIISVARRAPFLKYEIKEPNIYMQNLLKGDFIMSQFITKKDLVDLLEEGINLGVYVPDSAAAQKTPDQLAQMVFEGEISLDLDGLRKGVAAERARIEQEQAMQKARGGLTHEELRDKILQGVVNGALSIHHGEIAPYSRGFEVQFSDDGNRYKNRWECYCPFPEVPEKITCRIEKASQDNKVFSSYYVQPVDINAILNAIDEKETHKITTFVEEAKAGLERRGRYTGHVANLHDVHNGKALDGIILGHFSGDYSSITTGSQNDLMKTLVAMKGFCLDAIDCLPRGNREYAISFLKANGTDISTPDKLNAWIKANPAKCAFAENRAFKPSFAEKVANAEARASNSPKGKETEHEL